MFIYRKLLSAFPCVLHVHRKGSPLCCLQILLYEILYLIIDR